MYGITFFRNLYDTDSSKYVEFKDFKDLEESLYDLAHVRANGKESRPLVSSAKFNGTRKNDNVVSWTSWCCLDVDNFKGIADIKAALNFSFYYVCYSTASSTRGHPKFRLVIPLNRPVLSDEINHFWYSLTKFLDIGADEQTKDKARMFYVPALYKDAYNFIWTHEGPYLNVDEIKSKFEYTEIKAANNFFDTLPKELQEKVLAHRKQSLNKYFSWTSYHDCPFINKEMVSDFASMANIDGSGRYRKLYSIMVSISSRAIKMGYDINENVLVELIKQIDRDTTNKYQNRKLHVEAKNAISFAYRNGG